VQIQVHTDGATADHHAVTAHVETVIEGALRHFNGQITRVDVHLSDENSIKGGVDDKRCTLEARMHGHQPLAATHQAETMEKAVHGAADKIKRSIEHTIGRLRDR
jgi:ribosome-associated translation inhibitor RaiA